jgi:two-component system, LytTR family, response regulator
MKEPAALPCLIIDKDPKSAKQLLKKIKALPQLHVVHACTCIDEAMVVMSDHSPRIIFLDAGTMQKEYEEFLSQMPKEGKQLVLTSDKKEDAVHAFNLQAIDFIMKPVSDVRLSQTLARIVKHERKSQNGKALPRALFIKSGYHYLKVLLKEIYYIELKGTKLLIYTDRQVYEAKGSLKDILSHLPEKDFARIHKAGIVRIDRIQSIEGDTIEIQGRKEVAAEKYREALLEKLGLN